MTPVTSVRFSSLGTPWPAPPPGMPAQPRARLALVRVHQFALVHRHWRSPVPSGSPNCNAQWLYLSCRKANLALDRTPFFLGGYLVKHLRFFFFHQCWDNSESESALAKAVFPELCFVQVKQAHACHIFCY